MTVYEYPNIATRPNFATRNSEGVLISGIIYDIPNSTMTNKDYIDFRWDEDTEILKCGWNGSLDSSDKSELDTIVTNNS